MLDQGGCWVLSGEAALVLHSPGQHVAATFPHIGRGAHFGTLPGTLGLICLCTLVSDWVLVAELVRTDSLVADVVVPASLPLGGVLADQAVEKHTGSPGSGV